jgi:hypothetical protein
MKVLSNKSFWLMLVMLMSLPMARSFGADAGSLIDGKFDARSRRERQQIAQDLLQKIQQLDSILPEIKPSEEAWLEREKTAIDHLPDNNMKKSRLKNYLMSSESQQDKLQSLVIVVSTNLSLCISQEYTDAARSPPIIRVYPD